MNEPPHVQYAIFLKNILNGDFGRSIRSRRPVIDEIRTRLWPTLELAVGSLAVALVLGVSTGVLSAVRPNSWVDAVSMFIALVGVSMPVFWLGLMFMYLFSYQLSWFPTTGRGTWRHLVLPALTLGLGSAAIIARMTRSSMLEVMRQDYVRTGRAKGLSERVIVLKHAFRNALIPIITVTGLQFGTLLGGADLTESVFGVAGHRAADGGIHHRSGLSGGANGGARRRVGVYFAELGGRHFVRVRESCDPVRLRGLMGGYPRT